MTNRDPNATIDNNTISSGGSDWRRGLWNWSDSGSGLPGLRTAYLSTRVSLPDLRNLIGLVAIRRVLGHGAASIIPLVSDAIVARMSVKSGNAPAEAFGDVVKQGEKNAGEAIEAASEASADTANSALATFTTQQLESKWKHAAINDGVLR
jgi:hypothetical protein